MNGMRGRTFGATAPQQRMAGNLQRKNVIVAAAQAQPALRLSDGSKIALQNAAPLTLGSSSDADIPLASPAGVAPQHAKLELKSGRLFCTALAPADPDSLLSPTAVWLEGTELRPNVAYMVAPGATLCFGSEGSNAVVAEFDEAGAGGLADMLMQGMASGAAKEVQERLSELS